MPGRAWPLGPAGGVVSHTSSVKRVIAELEGKLTNKNEVIAELMQEHVQLKKELGEL